MPKRIKSLRRFFCEPTKYVSFLKKKLTDFVDAQKNHMSFDTVLLSTLKISFEEKNNLFILLMLKKKMSFEDGSFE